MSPFIWVSPPLVAMIELAGNREGAILFSVIFAIQGAVWALMVKGKPDR